MTIRQKVIIGVLTLIMIGILGVIILFNSAQKKRGSKKTTNIKYVRTMVVDNDTIDQWIQAHGRVISAREINVSSEVSGKLLEGDVTLRQGTSFKKGDVLFRIYADDYLYQVKARRANFINLVAGALPDLKVDFADSYQKWEDFYRQIDVDKNLPPLPPITSTKEKTFLASRGILTDYYGIKSDEGRLEKYIVRAPFNGSIETVFAEPGATVNPGMNIARIIQSNKLEIMVPVGVENAKHIRIHAPARIMAHNGKEVYSGRVVRKQESLNANTQTISVFIKFDESVDVFPGQYFNVSIFSQKTPNSFKVPRRAFNNMGEVMIIKDSALVAVIPQIIHTSRDSVIVTGLPDGALVVNEPLEYISIHTKVAPIR